MWGRARLGPLNASRMSALHLSSRNTAQSKYVRPGMRGLHIHSAACSNIDLTSIRSLGPTPCPRFRHDRVDSLSARDIQIQQTLSAKEDKEEATPVLAEGFTTIRI